MQVSFLSPPLLMGHLLLTLQEWRVKLTWPSSESHGRQTVTLAVRVVATPSLFSVLSIKLWYISRQDTARIGENQVFNTKFRNTLVEGDPGIGKTYLGLHLSHAWIKRYPQYQLRDIDLLILIRPSDIRSSFEETIMAALKGSDREKRVMFAFWKWHPKKCCIVVDALDEISSNAKVVNELFDLMEKKACYFIVTCRTRHPVLDKRMDAFQRIVQVVGFDRADVVPFIRKFLTSTNQIPEYVGGMCEVVSQSEKLLGLCCNPLG